MIRIDAGCRCGSRTTHVYLRCVYKNVIAFGRVALLLVCLYLISLAVLELKYRSPPGMSQYECVVRALAFCIAFGPNKGRRHFMFDEL
jgi:hypothetical protein